EITSVALTRCERRARRRKVAPRPSEFGVRLAAPDRFKTLTVERADRLLGLATRHHTSVAEDRREIGPDVTGNDAWTRLLTVESIRRWRVGEGAQVRAHAERGSALR